MNDVQFFQTRIGRQFYDQTLPALVEAVDRLASAVAEDRREPVVDELVSYARDLCDAAEAALNVEIVPGSTATREAFDLLRANAAAVRRILAKLPQ